MRVLQAGIDKSGNYWLWRILRLLMDEAGIERKSWILNDPIYQVSKTWELSFPEATELDVITWDTSPAAAYESDSYDTQPLRERAYYYCVIPMYRRRIQNLGEYVAASTHLWTHAPWHDNLPQELLGGIDKIVYIVRDPRDVMVSGAHYVDSPYCRREFGIPRVPLEHRYRRLLRNCPEWALHVAGWIGHARDIGLGIVSYEGLVTDLPFQLRRLSAYLGLGLSDAQLARVEEQVVFRSMKSATQGPHVRKGLVGNWREELPEPVAAEATAALRPLLDLMGYDDTTRALSSFLMNGEPSDELLAALEQINALQWRARQQVAPGSPSGGTGTARPQPFSGWR
jgi:Sulfotransferase domain